MSGMAVEYEIRPISVAEYQRMGEVGIIGPHERVELLDGALIRMPPIGPQHGFSVRELARAFIERLGARAVVDIAGTVILDDYSEPQPDLMLLAPCHDRYHDALPRAHAPLLVVEVAQSTLPYDRGRKLRAYGRAGIREVWIVDLPSERIELFSGLAEAEYRDVRAFGRGESIAPGAFPDEAFSVDEIIG